MSSFWVLWRKELAGYFLSPVAYVTTAFFLLVMGLVFYLLTGILAAGTPGVGLMNLMFGSPFYWMTQLVVVPVLTMRLFAEERRMGTLETLLTAPITDTQVVAAKFAGVFSFYTIMWIPTALFLVGLQAYAAESPPLDPGVIAAGYFGMLLSGAMYLAIGLLCSLTTSNQIVAAISCFSLLILVLFAGFVEYLTAHPAARILTDLMAPHRHMMDFARGVVDTRPVIYFVSVTIGCLFTAVRLLESRQWR
ncbi:MAG TPA: ABC transporter permease [Kiritimatiellia bacterium]|nr:ABC transporter permease [Kiritimatiellia bacterium]HMO97699.1 ABC transporter permease [Kiritimatiellia bacterium]HMP95559.1 ABC transporter permease [Kiritimatiellia bacterium]